ncbi:MAG: hypothetical protein DCF31_14010 [Alphaproteobacteria bacterium]|nr:MAG: hypothetical protein DCF31_14010 [Alphaproteobacteria bacterium]
MERWLAARETLALWSILVAGFVFRLGWLFLRPAERLQPHESEMWRVAVAFARTGTLADAYRPGSGISSHVGPFNTILAGMVYRVFGVGTLPSELIMAVGAAAVAAALFWALYRVAAELGIPIVPRLAALAFVSLVPLNFYSEVVDFRIREAAFAAMIAALGLLRLLQMEKSGTIDLMRLAGFALLAAFAFLINPAISLALYAGIAWIALRRLPVRGWPAGVAIGIAAFAIVNGAWIARNYDVYGRFMPSRGNFGLELDTANHDAAVDPADARAVFIARSQEIHPSFSDAALARLKTYPSDVAYFDVLGAEAKAWIAAHPGAFVGISLRHLRELYFPPRWQWNLYGDSPQNAVAAKQALKWTITALALAMLLIGLFERPRLWLYVALGFALPTLLYMILQPTLRYRYIFEGMLVFLAAALVGRLVQRIAGGRASSSLTSQQ